MALITRSTAASMDTTTGMKAPQISGLYAGEDIDVAAPCYVKASDGKVYMTNGTGTTEVAAVWGFSPRAAKSGQPVTIFGAGARFQYGSGLTVGTLLFAGATAGRLDNVATVGDAVGCAVVLTDKEILVVRANCKRVA